MPPPQATQNQSRGVSNLSAAAPFPVNSTQHFTSQSMATTSGVRGPRKKSHKAAEQKWRSSLKALFDELRLLLSEDKPAASGIDALRSA